MTLAQQRARFEATRTIHGSAKLTFHGVDGFDVYNPSIPFVRAGREFIFGRVERRHEWARSWARLFARTGPDEWTVVPDSMIYPIEDPYVSVIGDHLVMGGTHVVWYQKDLKYHACFYRGTQLDDLYYFTTGPDNMKDIRLVELADGRVGVFSRPRDASIHAATGSYSQIGFAVIDSLDDLTPAVIEEAPYIPGIFEPDSWGGCNQVYRLASGQLGVVGHICYPAADPAGSYNVYMNMSFVFDPARHEVSALQIIGTRTCYPEGPTKVYGTKDTAFTAGIVMRADGRADLYSGLNDCEVGRAVIDYPFAGHGDIVTG